VERRVARRLYNPAVWTASTISSMRALSNQGVTAHEAYRRMGMAEKRVSLSQFRSIGYKQKPPIHWKRSPNRIRRASGTVQIGDFAVLTRLGEEARRKGIERGVLATQLLRIVLQSQTLIDNLLDN
jgi:hypothetical protein